MKELGRILQTTRESKNLTLDEIQERTKIRKRYLQAIEEGNLSVLPGLVYARGFIKSYAEQLGLDGQTLLQEHGLLEESSAPAPVKYSTPKPEVQKTEVSQQKIASPGLDQGNRLLPQVLMGIAIIGILSVGYWFLTNREATPEPVTPQVQQPTTPPVQSPAAPTSPPAEQKPTGPLKSEAKGNGKSIYKVEGEKIKLEVNAANGDCWLEIRVDGETKLSKLVTKDTTLSFVGTKEVVVVAGYSPALMIKVNDLSVELEQVKDRYEFLFQKK